MKIEADDGREALLGMTLEQLRRVVADESLPRYAADQIARWLYVNRATDIAQMTSLSKSARERLAQKYRVGRETPLARAESRDGTVKYLFDSGTRLAVESVFIPSTTDTGTGDRATLCVSSQAGCKMRCAFCMTGRQGWHGNLTAHQIINQVMSVDGSDELTNIVFMGMGEPLDNIEAVKQAIEVLTAPWGLAWSPKRITVSTIGLTDGLRDILENTKVHIAVSVHSPFADQRQELMPTQKTWPVESTFNMLADYDFAHQRRLSIEYILWRGLNDSPRHAKALARLARKAPGTRVNLIRFHADPSQPDSRLQPCSPQAMDDFRDSLNAQGVIATVRASRGEDILAACGMLAGNKAERQEARGKSQE